MVAYYNSWSTEQLNHPNWKTFRLKIIGRDQNTCLNCGGFFGRAELNVHHRCYFEYTNGTRLNMWEYDENDVITLCRNCHTAGHKEHGRSPVYIIN